MPAAENQKNRKNYKNILSRAGSGPALFAYLTIIICAFTAWSIAPLIQDIRPVSSTKILARDNTLLYEISRPEEGLRTAAPLDQMPQSLKDAVVATEDKRFFSHSGVDRIALVRAVLTSLISQEIVSGGSTIEMQLIKNLYFPNAPRSFPQKLRELVAAEYWSLTHTKNETLETYLNTVPLGNQTNGVAAAANRYFRKSIQDLTLSESALLAGVINGPTRFDPYTRRPQSLARSKTVLARLLANKKVTQENIDDALANQPTIWAPTHPIKAPHFVESVIQELEEQFPNLKTGGYTIKTTLDPEIQSITESAIAHRLEPLSRKNVTSAAAVILDPQTGDTLAYVGSPDFWNNANGGQIDMASTPRQPGSALKPFLVFQSLRENQITPATVIPDLPSRFDDAYYPKNFTTRYYGPTTVRDALGSSLNIPMVKILDTLGINAFFATLSRFGLTYENPPEYYGKSVILGGAETPLKDVTRAYAELALYGKNVDVRSVLEIRDAKNKVIFSAKTPTHAPLFSENNPAESAAALVTNILTDNEARSLAFGEANLMETGKNVAVKSGTTKDFKDNLAFGYTPNLAVGVWIGNADNSPMQGITGVTGAVPILHDVFIRLLTNQKPVDWPLPTSLVAKDICLPSGKLLTEHCQKYRRELFQEGTEPTEKDTWWQTNGKLILPAEYADYVKRTKYEVVKDSVNTAQILSPIDGDRYILDQKIAQNLQKIPFTASIQNPEWELNSVKIPKQSSEDVLWQPKAGEYTLTLVGTNQSIHFSVR